MAARYRCPSCRANRVRFAIVFNLWQEIHKDQQTGVITYRADEWRTVQREDGLPDVSIRCLECGHTDREAAFISAGRKAT